jgi:uncharacterized protein (DUF1684 family)
VPALKLRLATIQPGVVGGAVFVLALGGAACNPKPPDEGGYVRRIEVEREEKDTFLRNDAAVVPSNRKDDLLPLLYFPIDPSFHVPAVLSPSNDDTTIMMPTSAGTQDPYRRVGTLEFTLNGQPHKLSAFAPAAAKTVDRLFVPFRDQTSGTETYPGGRYLDIDRMPSGIYQIDFNKAYNPNCYFSPTWICPLPPRENSLTVAVEAGERVRAEDGKSAPS